MSRSGTVIEIRHRLRVFLHARGFPNGAFRQHLVQVVARDDGDQAAIAVFQRLPLEGVGQRSCLGECRALSWHGRHLFEILMYDAIVR
jgi:hypothetical protein